MIVRLHISAFTIPPLFIVLAMSKATEKPREFSNVEIVTLALYLIGGESQNCDVEDVAVKSHELAAERFSWNKYPQQIRLDRVNKRLYDARNANYLTGSDKSGWLLTENGVRLAKELLETADFADFGKKSLTLKEKQWLRGEKVRLLASEAFQKAQSEGINAVTRHEAEAFFRIDAYVAGEARSRKIHRVVNNFGDDAVLGEIVTALAARLEEK